MPFPHCDKLNLKKNTLNSVVCQVMFPTILEISASAPANFQKVIRKDYPRYEALAGNVPPGIPPEVLKVLGNGLRFGPNSQDHQFSTNDSRFR